MFIAEKELKKEKESVKMKLHLLTVAKGIILRRLIALKDIVMESISLRDGPSGVNGENVQRHVEKELQQGRENAMGM